MHCRKIVNDKGISLIELLIVFVIMMMIMAMLLISYNVINRTDVNRCTRRLENILRDARVTTMSKGREAGRLHLYANGGNIYGQIGDENPQLISGGGVFFYAIKSESGSAIPTSDNVLSGGHGYVVFETSGRLKMVGPDPSEGAMPDYSTVNVFLLTKGKRTYYVRVYKDTGYVEVIDAGSAGVADPTPADS